MRLAAIVILIAVVASIGYGVWDAGYDRGLIDAADSTTEIVVTERYRGGFFPFGAIFGFFFLFLFLGFLSRIAFGGRRWGCRPRGSGPDGYKSHMDERMSRWHDQAHGNAPPADSASPPPSPVS
jgi:hypothetical protein